MSLIVNPTRLVGKLQVHWETVSKKKVESDWGGHLMLKSDLPTLTCARMRSHTHSHTHTPFLCWTIPQKQFLCMLTPQAIAGVFIPRKPCLFPGCWDYRKPANSVVPSQCADRIIGCEWALECLSLGAGLRGDIEADSSTAWIPLAMWQCEQ